MRLGTREGAGRSLAPVVLGAILLIAAAFTTALVVSQRSVAAIRGVVDQITLNSNPSIAHLGEARRALWTLQFRLLRLRARAISGEPLDVQPSLDARHRISAEWSAYLLLPPFQGEPAAQAAERVALERAQAVAERIIHAAAADDRVAIADMKEADLAEAFDNADSGLNDLIQINLAGGRGAAVHVEELRRTAAQEAYLLGGIALALSLALAILLYRAMGRLARLQAEHLSATAQERRELATRLWHAERLATLGQVVAEVAHEIGTPLNVITGRADFLQQELQGDESAVATIATISDQTRRITRIIERLLGFARERTPSLEPVPVKRVALSTAGYLAPDAASAGVTIRIDGDEKLLARADADLLQQVLFNLLQNAIQAGSASGVVRVQVGSEAGEVVVDVIDDGPGIAPQILPRVFEPFTTTKPAGKGTGLGLSISRTIVHQMSGSLRYVERPRGAHFQIRLPTPELRFDDTRAAPQREADAARKVMEESL
jgi:signal transduction histidine kinase